MPRPTEPRRSMAAWISLTLGGGGVGWLGVAAVFHRADMAVLGTAVIISALGASAIESIYKSRPEIIRAKGTREAARIRATSEASAHVIKETSEAQALLMRTRTRTMLLRAGIEAGLAGHVAEMLKQQSLDVDLPRGRRLSDNILASLLAEDRHPPTTGGASAGAYSVVAGPPVSPDTGSSSSHAGENRAGPARQVAQKAQKASITALSQP